VRAATGHAPCDVLIVPQESDLWSHCIVLATDGSPHARRAADLAASIGVAFGLPLRVVSAALRQDADAEAAAHIERALAAIATAGAHATGRVVDGRPEEAILRCAREIGADLIVLGRRGMNRAARALVGSTTEKVAGQASGPVLIVRAE